MYLFNLMSVFLWPVFRPSEGEEEADVVVGEKDKAATENEDSDFDDDKTD